MHPALSIEAQRQNNICPTDDPLTRGGAVDRCTDAFCPAYLLSSLAALAAMQASGIHRRGEQESCLADVSAAETIHAIVVMYLVLIVVLRIGLLISCRF